MVQVVQEVAGQRVDGELRAVAAGPAPGPLVGADPAERGRASPAATATLPDTTCGSCDQSRSSRAVASWSQSANRGSSCHRISSTRSAKINQTSRTWHEYSRTDHVLAEGRRVAPGRSSTSENRDIASVTSAGTAERPTPPASKPHSPPTRSSVQVQSLPSGSGGAGVCDRRGDSGVSDPATGLMAGRANGHWGGGPPRSDSVTP